MSWFVYLVQCADDSLYCGVAKDVARRVEEHNGDKKAAKYCRARQPVKLVYCEPANNRSSACQREAQIKKLSRQQKLSLVQSYDPEPLA